MLAAWIWLASIGCMELDVGTGQALRRVPPPDGRWSPEIEACSTPTTTLRAVDSESGADIPEIELVPIRLLGERRRTSTPVELFPWGDRDPCSRRKVPTRRWWVRAPGYAWTRAVVDFSIDGERVVELRREGIVRVQLLGAGRKWTAALHLSPVGEPRELQRSVWPTWQPEQPLDLEGLEQGEYRLEVWGSMLLAQTTFRVRTGKSTRIELDIPH